MSTSVYSEIRDHFRGYARLNLANIQLTADEAVHEADVEQLIKNFGLRGCLQHNPAYAISVIVNSDTLAAATNGQTDLTLSDESPFRRINIRATCLHGRYRILAARLALQEPDRWWTARLFDSGKLGVQFPPKQLKLIILPELPTTAREFIRHEYMHKSNPTDGEILRQVLVAEHERDETAATCWSAMLTARKRRNLTELKKIDGGGLLAAITPLLPFAAL
jgi:hypothetical protein